MVIGIADIAADGDELLSQSTKQARDCVPATDHSCNSVTGSTVSS